MRQANRARTLREEAIFVVSELERRVVKIDPSSRIAEYARAFEEDRCAAPWGPSDQQRLNEGLIAMRDVREIATILDGLPLATARELQELVKDASTPRTDRATPGRDRQLELFVGATCRMGGMDIKLNHEPDLWCQAKGVWIGLAVKRVRSPKQFAANLDKACDQIQRSDLLFGFAVMDMSLAWNQDLRVVISSRTRKELAWDLRERIERFLDEQIEVLHRVWAKFPKALGLLCIDLTFSHLGQDGWGGDRFQMFHSAGRNPRQMRIAGGFQEGWIRGCPEYIDMAGVPRTGQFCGPAVDLVLPLRAAD